MFGRENNGILNIYTKINHGKIKGWGIEILFGKLISNCQIGQKFLPLKFFTIQCLSVKNDLYYSLLATIIYNDDYYIFR